MIKCQKCGARLSDGSLEGTWLERVNEKGVDGIWECRPSCGSRLSQSEALIAAIEHRESEHVTGTEDQKVP